MVNWQRQGGLFILAVVFAIYHVSKNQAVLDSYSNQTISQFKHVRQILMSNGYFQANKYELFETNDQRGVMSLMIVRPGTAGSPPVIIGEILNDALAQRKLLEKKRGKKAIKTSPLLLLRIHHEEVIPIKNLLVKGMLLTKTILGPHMRSKENPNGASPKSATPLKINPTEPVRPNKIIHDLESQQQQQQQKVVFSEKEKDVDNIKQEL